MARAKGSAKFSGNLEVAAGGPLDARSVVPTQGDLTVASNFPYSYVGMIVSVQDEGKAYILTAKPVTTEGNWKVLGSGEGADNIVEGYYKSADHLFYEESTFETPIEGKNKTLYIDLVSNNSYRYSGSIFVRIDEEYGPAYVVEGYRNDNDGLFYREAVFENAITGVTGVIYVALNENKTYRWAGAAFTRLDKESPELVFGYYKATDGLMYEEAAFTNAIAGDDEKLYIGLNVDKIYRYTGVSFVELSKEKNNVVRGYYYNSLFYKEAEHIHEITGELDVIYIDLATKDTYYWTGVKYEKLNETTSGGGSTQKAISASITVGGIEKNDSFPVGTDYDDMWETLLNPTLYPTFTAPSANLTYALDNNGYYKVGGTVSAKTATLEYNAGAIVLDGVKQNDRAGAATKYSIVTTGADTDFDDTSNDSGSFNIPQLTRATKGTIKITGIVNYAAGPQPKDSKGGNYSTPLVAGNVTAEKTLNFIQPYYYGASDNSTIGDFTGLTEVISAKGNKTYKFTTNNQYMIFAYDSSYGNLKNILDPNSFETISGWVSFPLQVNGFNYKVYVSESPTTDTEAAFTFKY